MTYEITCAVCGTLAIKRKKKAKYCSRKCNRKSYEIRTGRKKPKFIEKMIKKADKKGVNQVKTKAGNLTRINIPIELSEQIEATQSNLKAWRYAKQELLRRFEAESQKLPGSSYENWATALGAGVGVSKIENEDGAAKGALKIGAGAIIFKIASRGIMDAFFKDYLERQQANKLDKLKIEIDYATKQITALEINLIGQKRKRAKIVHQAPEKNKTSDTIRTAENYRKQVIDTLGFKDAYLYLMGDPAANFYAVLTGSPGNGKSTFAVQFANYFQSKHGKVLLMAAEQRGINKPLQQLLRRYKAKFDIETEPQKWDTKKWIEAANEYQLIIVDSATHLDLAPEQIENIRENAPKTAFLVILQSTKDGKYKGSTEWKHNCDIFLKAENMQIHQTKSRYSKPAHIVLDEF